ncbi:hypothetical protein BDV97DRAFT_398990 [Delphinella strobiligena]|nr:hypothetical protein BDV97DRAFT_398990 [Delphinella strobiligena]
MAPISSGHIDKEHEPPTTSDVSMDIIDGHRVNNHPANKSQNYDGKNIDGTVENGTRSDGPATVSNMKDAPLSAAVESNRSPPSSMTVKSDSTSIKSKHIARAAERTKLAAALAALYDPDTDGNDLGLVHPDAAKTSPSPIKEAEPNMNPNTVNQPATDDAHLSDESDSEPPKPLSGFTSLTGDRFTELDRPTYVKDYAALPADRDIGYPHIVTGRPRGGIDGCQWDQANLRAADGIVTYLHRCTGLPRALETFLDMEEDDFCLVTEGNAGTTCEGTGLSITRNENIVEIGRYYKWKNERIWEPMVEYEIVDDGKWVPRSGLVGLGHAVQYDAFRIESIGFVLAFSLIWTDDLEHNSTTTMYSVENDDGELIDRVWHRGGYDSSHSESK